MDRRSVLGLAGALALLPAASGCLGSRGENSIQLTPAAPPPDPPVVGDDELSSEQAAFIERARDEPGYTTPERPPFDGGEFVELEGEFYCVTVDDADAIVTSRSVLGATLVDDTVDPGDPVALDAYPEADRERIREATRLARLHDPDAGADDEIDDDPEADDRRHHGDAHVYVFDDVDEEDTDLLPAPEHEYVRVEDDTVRLWVGSRQIRESGYRATVSHVASGERSFEEAVHDSYVVDLDDHDLSDEQHEIVRTAIEEGEYRETGSISEGLNDIVNLLMAEAPAGGTCGPAPDSLLRYEDEYYEWDYGHVD